MNGFNYKSNVYHNENVFNKFVSELKENFKFMGEDEPKYEVFSEEADNTGKYLKVWVPNQELCNILAISEAAMLEYELFGN